MATEIQRGFVQGLRYAVIGVLQLAVEWLLFWALTSFGLLVPVANVVGRVVAALSGYVLNGAWTFRDGGEQPKLGKERLARFVTSWVALTIVSTLVITLVTRVAGLETARWVKPFVDVALAGVGFLVSRHWVYR